MVAETAEGRIYVAEILDSYMSFEVLHMISINNPKQPIQCYVYSPDAAIVTDGDKDLPDVRFVLIVKDPRVVFSFTNKGQLNPIKPGLFEICQTREGGERNPPTPHNSTI